MRTVALGGGGGDGLRTRVDFAAGSGPAGGEVLICCRNFYFVDYFVYLLVFCTAVLLTLLCTFAVV